ncbi:hypothetical protein Dsin_015633 [Dipteronia sinensis]|uniref:Uncharacterized protein n=1 Tax=Dipteronia sinensis TaxID=43782 RepID=A0AAE0ACT2_9ROSI|nr:hypothetical protein Dsin_015633 [Dipteronia sinensis]
MVLVYDAGDGIISIGGLRLDEALPYASMESMETNAKQEIVRNHSLRTVLAVIMPKKDEPTTMMYGWRPGRPALHLCCLNRKIMSDL